MATWPASLPDAPLAEDFAVEPVPQSISTDMDTGSPKRRRRFSVAYRRYRMSFLLTDTQRDTFETFYSTTIAGGSGTIEGLTDPYTNGSATFQIADGGDPVWAPVKPSGTASARLWKLTLGLERTA